MKKLMTILISMMFINTLIAQPPSNKDYNIIYNEDRSISFNGTNPVKIPEDKIYDMIKIFEKADKIVTFLKDNENSEFKLVLGIIDGDTLIFVNHFNKIYGYLHCIDYKNSRLFIYNARISCSGNEKFIDLLTINRDKYYENLYIYNNKDKSKLSEFLNKL
jgi:hypothetical protein